MLRQITTCTDPATTIIERHSPTGDRTVLYYLGTCRRHRWLAREWRGQRRRAPGGEGRCGVVLDYRSYDRIVQSHVDLWIGPASIEHPQKHSTIAHTLRTAATSRARSTADWARNPWEIETALAAALDHAATIAEAIDAGAVDAESGQHQVLAVLSTAETIDAATRGA
ncbi:hypothetical protein ACIQGT_40425 [Streptomyces sp. NPDC093108]|uniref:hypothetical protein n=1 Tax=Streptomyces sp. NPDC093108 TaxID=3366030 RepID=UPI00380FD383